MSKTSTYKSLFFSEGSIQDKRYIEALNPNSVELMDFSVEDWMTFAYKFSKHVKHVKDENDLKHINKAKPQPPLKSWEVFFKKAEEIKDMVEDYKEGDIDPHLALFVCFLKLLEHSKSRFNEITKRHLDFYYKNILDLKKQDSTPDSVYAIFELAKNAGQQLIEEGTALDAGKDSLGNPKAYHVEEETLINKISLGSLKSTFQDNLGWYMAPEPKSADGQGAEIDSESQSWLPFGDSSYASAEYGFSLASPSLKMSEGPRSITLKFQLAKALNFPMIKAEVVEALKFKITGKSGWIELSVSADDFSISNSDPFQLIMNLQLSDTDDPIVNYDPEIHEGSYKTFHPVLKIQFNNKTLNLARNSFRVYKLLVNNALEDISITTSSLYTKSLKVINDTGIINTKNAFYPFGPLAKSQAKLKVTSEEWIGKNITQTELKLTWKDLPDSFQTHYAAYTETTVENGIYNESARTYINDDLGQNRFKVKPSLITDHRKTLQDLNTADREGAGSRDDSGAISANSALFQSKEDSQFQFFPANNGGYTPLGSDDYLLQLELENDFFHDVYAKVLTAHAIAKKEAPNAPYTPEADSIAVSITTQENFKTSGHQIQLFHDYPYGYIAQHSAENEYLVQNLNQKGELYLGLEHCKPGDSVQFLFQLEEGTENPDAITAEGYAKIEWHYLFKNEWKAFNSELLLKDETNNFLKTGLVKLNIPKEFDTENTLLPSGYFWVKASQHTKDSGKNLPDTVSRFIDVFPQASIAVFENNNNELSHLKDGLPAETISKLVNRLSGVKSVQQPFASFEGKPVEGDLDFYRRVSERLRHKNRAISHWDYEHVVLQKFPHIYKVKCLNHSNENCNQSPGNVLLVVVPNIKTQNVFDKYKPRLSANKLTEIQNYVESLNGLLVNCKVISPVYETVKMSLKVKFHKDLDQNLYTTKLKEDLAKMLAPWAYDDDANIGFSNTLYASEVIHFLEKLEYVDYIKNFSFYHQGKYKQKVVPSHEQCILTSVLATEHDVQYLTKSICTA